MQKYVNNQKLIKDFCSNLDNNYLRSDIEQMLDEARIPYTKGAPKSELCSLLTKNLPSRILEAILIYGSQVGKGAAVSLVISLIIGSLFAPGALTGLAAETATGVPIVYGALTGIYDGATTIMGKDERAYKDIKRKTNKKK